MNLQINDDEIVISIVPILKPYLYSIAYGDDDDQFNKFFDFHNNVTMVRDFLIANAHYLTDNPVWKNIPNVDSATRQVLWEAEDLEEVLYARADNAAAGKEPDLDSHFKYLDGPYRDTFEYVPMKSYGPGRPSLLRLYAIKLERNRYVITGGGIKLSDKIQTSPGLKDCVMNDIRRARDYISCISV